MQLSKQAVRQALEKNSIAWDRKDLEGVLELYHDEVYFENWTGGNTQGKDALREAWTPWFASGGDFKFIRDDLFFDEEDQKATATWELRWPSTEKGFEGKPEKRRGLDIYHFKDGKVIKKLTYSKTTVEIEGKRVRLKA